MSLLPEIRDRRHYAEIFTKDGIWTPAIQKLADQLGLQGPLHRGVRSSHIVYRIGDSWIKLIAPMFAQDGVFEIAALNSVRGKLSVATPKILDQGEREGWVYLLLSHLPGERIGDLWRFLSPDEKILRARQMARATREIHHCTPDADLCRRGDWNSFIRDRHRNLVNHHQFKNLEKGWIEALPNFMAKFSENEFFTADPRMLHADLTWDHFLVERENRSSPGGLIDFADSRLGHPEYDLPATLAFILKGER
jgi:hygromycin-B 7''-O-kinase